MTYTVKQLADIAGVSARTLHYYDEIGLLSPVSVGSNGYRQYNFSSLLLLQQKRRARDAPVVWKLEVVTQRRFPSPARSVHLARLASEIVGRHHSPLTVCIAWTAA